MSDPAQLLLRNTSAIAFIKDGDGRYELVSEGWCEFMGLSAEQAIGRTLDELFEPDVARALVARDQHVLSTGRPDRRNWQLQVGDRTASFLSEVHPLHDDHGHIVGLAGIATEVTELRRRDAEVARQKRILDDLERTADVGGWEMDLASGRLTWTDHTYRLHGLEPGDTEPRLSVVRELYTTQSVRRAAQAILACRSEHRALDIELDLHRSQGGPRVLRVAGQPVPGDDGEVVRILGTVQDITAQRRLEDQLRRAQKLEGLGRLAGGIAHDFNNLLTVIHAGLEFLHEAVPDDSEARADLEDVRYAATRASDLTAQLLAFARQQRSAPRHIDPREVLSRATRLVRRVVGATIQVELSVEHVGSVYIDPGQLEQVLVNMAANARDAMPSGGRLRIACSAVELHDDEALALGLSAGPYVRLSVTDTGHGMDKATRKRIFDPFFTTKEPGRGTGLGLSTAYGIVRQARGNIRVASTPGEGTRFEVLLPEEDVPAEELDSLAPDDEPSAAARILLAEDDRAVREVARRTLERSGYVVVPAPSGVHALEHFEAGPDGWDLLLTDVVMPGKDGIALAQAIRAVRPGLPVVFMSGYAEDVLAERGLAAEDVDLLAKPFSPDGLLRAVQRRLAEV